ncbi:membrane protein [Leisingera sp. ANG-Vp]|uniref:membrane protein n=1 Tax=Leisingera sp. ANG-Vp TaxID=1577896 RepID=UPI00057D0197|nr:membrane protein [Leisingera sp. ANG-Vp]KIC14095.1 membrane protein [Leisingera sp. ANG-Vp]
MPNALAYLMLLAWPLASVILFRRLPLERAILWCLTAGYLLLPPLAEFDLPLVPDMDKFAIPSVMAFLLCAYLLRKPVPLLPQHPVARTLAVLFVFGVIPTVLTNSEPIQFRKIANSDPIIFLTDQLPGLRWRDLGSVIINQVIVLMPFLLARRYLSTPEAQRELLLALMLGGLAYTIPSLIEIRLSPQINVWVYGFFQHDFSQMIRQGGFRPIVFLPHALWLAFFMMSAVLAATALARASQRNDRLRLALAAGYLFIVLVLCKSLASLAYALAFTPVVALAPLRWQLRVALLLGVIAVAYPVLRNTGLVPTETLVAQAEAISAERAHSLNYRFENEAQLLARAAEKTWFGWGGWGRNLVRHEETGQILSIPDGRWIIVFGTFGWLGYIAEMGLLATPLFLLAAAARRAPRGSVSPYAAPIALILAATLVDMLLNATLIPITWMCAGSVLGYAERLLYPDLFQKKRALFGGAQALQPDTAGPEGRSIL